MKKVKFTRNALVLNYRNYHSGIVAQALQYEPSKGLGENTDLTTAAIYVGLDGSELEDLISVLSERDSLKKQVEKQKTLWESETDRLSYAHERIGNLQVVVEKHINKKWWQFWK